MQLARRQARISGSEHLAARLLDDKAGAQLKIAKKHCYKIMDFTLEGLQVLSLVLAMANFRHWSLIYEPVRIHLKHSRK